MTEQELFERAAQLHREMDALKADLAQLKSDAAEDGIGKDVIADVVAAAKLHVSDTAKRAKAEEKRIRREQLAEAYGQGKAPASPAKRPDLQSMTPEELDEHASASVATEPDTFACNTCGVIVSSVEQGRCADCARTNAPPRWHGPETIRDLEMVR